MSKQLRLAVKKVIAICRSAGSLIPYKYNPPEINHVSGSG